MEPKKKRADLTSNLSDEMVTSTHVKVLDLKTWM